MNRNLVRIPPTRSQSASAVFTANDGIQSQLSALYALTEKSPHVFGSPLGPFVLRGAAYHLPRFVYFGPQSADDSVRLAFHAGFDGTDARSARALAHFVERLALTPEVGQGLNLSFFPLVNPSGLELDSRRNINAVDLAAENWENSDEPEVALLRHDAHVRSYHGFVRVESGVDEEIVGAVRSVHQASGSDSSVLFAHDSAGAFAVRWENANASAAAVQGPLSIADDYAVRPFEVVLRFPRSWNDDVYREAVTQTLKRFIVHYRATFAYGIHL